MIQSAHFVSMFLSSLSIGMLWFNLTAHAEGGIRRIGYDSEGGAASAVIVPGIGQIHTTQIFPDLADTALEAQIDSVLDNLERLLGKESPLLRLHICAHSQTVVDTMKKEIRKRFDQESAPSVTYVLGDLPNPAALVAVDAVAAAPTDAEKKPTGKPGAEDPIRILPAGPRVYISGQAEQGEFEAGVRGTMQSLFETLEFLGLSQEDVIQLKGFVQPMERAEEARKLMVDSFAGIPAPPIVLVKWSSSLPIEIELIASAKGKEIRRGKWKSSVEYITPPGMTASPVYSKLTYVEHPETIYVSGLYGDSEAGATEQIHSIFGTLKEILEGAGSDLRHLVKATYYVSNDDTSSELNKIRPVYYDPTRPPAASKAMVDGVGKGGTGIAIDMIAVPSGLSESVDAAESN